LKKFESTFCLINILFNNVLFLKFSKIYVKISLWAPKRVAPNRAAPNRAAPNRDTPKRARRTVRAETRCTEKFK